MARQRRKLGGIYAIPLPDGTFAFGRLYQEQLAIFKMRSSDMNSIPDFEIDFYVTVFKDILTDGEWPLVGMLPFKEGEEKWGPPQYIEDILAPGNYDIYSKGEIRSATKEECMGLESCSMWSTEPVVERLMGKRNPKICK